MNQLVTFTEQDFNVFTIPGLEERMQALKTHIRPKLETLGTNLAPVLSELVGHDMYPHVAKHARRTVNPPDDTWVAWAHDKRGYKKHPHFQVGLWQTHLFVWFALIYESPYKVEFARQALPEVTTIMETIPEHFVWSLDHMQPDAIKHASLTEQELTAFLERLQKVKKAELLCGIHVNRDDPLLLDGERLNQKIIDTFKQVVPLYRLAQPR